MSRRRKLKQVNNIVPAPSTAKVSQEAVGSDIYSSTGLKWQLPKQDTTLIEQYSENAILAEPLKNIKDLIFTTYADHPAPWITIKNPMGEIDDELSKQGQQIAKVCNFYPAHVRAYTDQELGGCSVWSPGWGTLEGVTGICPVELRNLPWNSFRELPQGFTEIYNDIMPGIVIDPSTGETRVFQTKDDRHRPEEVVQTSPLPAWIIVRDPTSPKPAGKPGCLPVIALITNYNYADKAWNQKMNRVAAPSIFPYVEKITAKNKEYVEALAKRWGKDTCFVLTEGMDFKNPYLTESSTSEERLAWLKKQVQGFYNPATFVQKDGNAIGASDSGAMRLINNRTVAVLSQLETGLGETLLQIWLDVNGFVGYSVEVRYPRPEVKDDTQILNEIAEANRNGHISRMEARQKYPNLDLPDLTPEEEAKMDAEYDRRKPQTSLFGGNSFGQPVTEAEEWASVKGRNVLQPSGTHIGNLSAAMPVSQTERELLAATRQCAADVKRIVKEKIGEQKIGGQ